MEEQTVFSCPEIFGMSCMSFCIKELFLFIAVHANCYQPVLLLKIFSSTIDEHQPLRECKDVGLFLAGHSENSQSKRRGALSGTEEMHYVIH